jgi:hypothetical protein
MALSTSDLLSVVRALENYIRELERWFQRPSSERRHGFRQEFEHFETALKQALFPASDNVEDWMLPPNIADDVPRPLRVALRELWQLIKVPGCGDRDGYLESLERIKRALKKAAKRPNEKTEAIKKALEDHPNWTSGEIHTRVVRPRWPNSTPKSTAMMVSRLRNR